MNENSDQVVWFEVQGNYGGQSGWEMLTCEDTREDAEQMLSDYAYNEPQYPHRIRRVRGLNSESE